MSCTSPVAGFLGPEGRFVVDVRKSPSKAPMEVPCGRCMSCKIARAADWGVRGAHEMKLHGCGSFLTLTYSDEFVPRDFSVSRRPLQLFTKRFRDAVAPKRIRFIGCGEYGDQGLRPHFHLAVFGYDFRSDRKAATRNASGQLLYQSPLLSKLWPFGQSWIGELNAASVAYIARYTTKKITGAPAEDHYRRVSPVDGVEYEVEREFLACSNRPGIGAGWAAKFHMDWIDSGFIVVDGQKRRVPHYYGSKLRKRLLAENVSLPSDRMAKERGMAKRAAHPEECTVERRKQKADVVAYRVAQHKRERLDGVR